MELRGSKRKRIAGLTALLGVLQDKMLSDDKTIILDNPELRFVDVSSKPWRVNLQSALFGLILRTDSPKQIYVRIGDYGGYFATYLNRALNLKPEMETITASFRKVNDNIPVSPLIEDLKIYGKVYSGPRIYVAYNNERPRLLTHRWLYDLTGCKIKSQILG